MSLQNRKRPNSTSGFTRLDLGVLCAACILLTVFVVLPRTARAGLEGNAAVCVNNLRRLGLAWTLYAADNQGSVVNNFTYAETQAEAANGTYQNWSHTILDWTTSPQNTNEALARTGKLSPYHNNDITPLRCPANTYATPAQAAKGWTGRVRSYSMNGFMGRFFPSRSTTNALESNPWSSGYRQFFLTSAIPSPAETMVFVEEHPNSINDGYFVNELLNPFQWIDYPAPTHEGGCGFSFADGSALIRLWQSAALRQPMRFGYLPSNIIPPAERGDIRWVTERMSVPHSTLAVHRQTNDTIELVWSGKNLQLQSMNPDSGGEWKTVPGPVTRGYARSSMTVPTSSGTTLFRLFQ